MRLLLLFCICLCATLHYASSEVAETPAETPEVSNQFLGIHINIGHRKKIEAETKVEIEKEHEGTEEEEKEKGGGIIGGIVGKIKTGVSKIGEGITKAGEAVVGTVWDIEKKKIDTGIKVGEKTIEIVKGGVDKIRDTISRGKDKTEGEAQIEFEISTRWADLITTLITEENQISVHLIDEILIKMKEMHDQIEEDPEMNEVFIKLETKLNEIKAKISGEKELSAKTKHEIRMEISAEIPNLLELVGRFKDHVAKKIAGVREKSHEIIGQIISDLEEKMIPIKATVETHIAKSEKIPAEIIGKVKEIINIKLDFLKDKKELLGDKAEEIMKSLTDWEHDFEATIKKDPLGLGKVFDNWKDRASSIKDHIKGIIPEKREKVHEDIENVKERIKQLKPRLETLLEKGKEMPSEVINKIHEDLKQMNEKVKDNPQLKEVWDHIHDKVDDMRGMIPEGKELPEKIRTEIRAKIEKIDEEIPSILDKVSKVAQDWGSKIKEKGEDVKDKGHEMFEQVINDIEGKMGGIRETIEGHIKKGEQIPADVMEKAKEVIKGMPDFVKEKKDILGDKAEEIMKSLTDWELDFEATIKKDPLGLGKVFDNWKDRASSIKDHIKGIIPEKREKVHEDIENVKERIKQLKPRLETLLEKGKEMPSEVIDKIHEDLKQMNDKVKDNPQLKEVWDHILDKVDDMRGMIPEGKELPEKIRTEIRAKIEKIDEEIPSILDKVSKVAQDWGSKIKEKGEDVKDKGHEMFEKVINDIEGKMGGIRETIEEHIKKGEQIPADVMEKAKEVIKGMPDFVKEKKDILGDKAEEIMKSLTDWELDFEATIKKDPLGLGKVFDNWKDRASSIKDHIKGIIPEKREKVHEDIENVKERIKQLKPRLETLLEKGKEMPSEVINKIHEDLKQMNDKVKDNPQLKEVWDHILDKVDDMRGMIPEGKELPEKIRTEIRAKIEKIDEEIPSILDKVSKVAQDWGSKIKEKGEDVKDKGHEMFEKVINDIEGKMGGIRETIEEHIKKGEQIPTDVMEKAKEVIKGMPDFVKEKKDILGDKAEEIMKSLTDWEHDFEATIKKDPLGLGKVFDNWKDRASSIKDHIKGIIPEKREKVHEDIENVKERIKQLKPRLETLLEKGKEMPSEVINKIHEDLKQMNDKVKDNPQLKEVWDHILDKVDDMRGMIPEGKELPEKIRTEIRAKIEKIDEEIPSILDKVSKVAQDWGSKIKEKGEDVKDKGHEMFEKVINDIEGKMGGIRETIEEHIKKGEQIPADVMEKAKEVIKGMPDFVKEKKDILGDKAEEIMKSLTDWEHDFEATIKKDPLGLGKVFDNWKDRASSIKDHIKGIIPEKREKVHEDIENVKERIKQLKPRLETLLEKGKEMPSEVINKIHEDLKQMNDKVKDNPQLKEVWDHILDKVDDMRGMIPEGKELPEKIRTEIRAKIEKIDEEIPSILDKVSKVAQDWGSKIKEKGEDVKDKGHEMFEKVINDIEGKMGGIRETIEEHIKKGEQIPADVMEKAKEAIKGMPDFVKEKKDILGDKAEEIMKSLTDWEHDFEATIKKDPLGLGKVFDNWKDRASSIKDHIKGIIPEKREKVHEDIENVKDRIKQLKPRLETLLEKGKEMPSEVINKIHEDLKQMNDKVKDNPQLKEVWDHILDKVDDMRGMIPEGKELPEKIRTEIRAKIEKIDEEIPSILDKVSKVAQDWGSKMKEKGEDVKDKGHEMFEKVINDIEGKMGGIREIIEKHIKKGEQVPADVMEKAKEVIKGMPDFVKEKKDILGDKADEIMKSLTDWELDFEATIKKDPLGLGKVFDNWKDKASSIKDHIEGIIPEKREKVHEDIENVKERIKQLKPRLETLLEKGKEMPSEVINKIHEDLKQMNDKVKDNPQLKEVWDHILDKVDDMRGMIPEGKELPEKIRTEIRAKIEKIDEEIPSILDKVSKVAQDWGSKIKEKGEDVKDKGHEMFEKVINDIEGKMGGIRETIEEHIKKGEQIPADVMEKAKEVIKGMPDFVKEKKDILGDKAEEIMKSLADWELDFEATIKKDPLGLGKVFNNWKDKVTKVKEHIKEKGENLKQKASEVMGKMGDYFGEKISGIKMIIEENEKDGKVSTEVLVKVKDTIKDMSVHMKDKISEDKKLLGNNIEKLEKLLDEWSIKFEVDISSTGGDRNKLFEVLVDNMEKLENIFWNWGSEFKIDTHSFEEKMKGIKSKIHITSSIKEKDRENSNIITGIKDKISGDMGKIGGILGKGKKSEESIESSEEDQKEGHVTPAPEKGRLHPGREFIKGVGRVGEGIGQGIDRIGEGIDKGIDRIGEGMEKVKEGISEGISKIGKEISLSAEAARELLFKKETGGWDTQPSVMGDITSAIGKGVTKGHDIIGSITPRLQAIFPGTLWCGAGNVSKTDKDVGLWHATDSCCEAHDKCTDNMEVGEEKHGLINTGTFTRSHCKCDDEFHDCLEKFCSPISSAIGNTYFNILGPQCFKETYPLEGCNKWVRTESNLTKCVEYKENKSGPKVWQWRDSRLFFCVLPNITAIEAAHPKNNPQ